MISDWGSWEDFQILLSRLSAIAEKHGGVTLTSVAIRWVLQKPQVGAGKPLGEENWHVLSGPYSNPCFLSTV